MGLRLAAVVLCAGLTMPVVAAPSPREESERLRADMEGQSERLRLSVETFMGQQDRRVGDALAAQDRRLDDLHRMVLVLAGLSAVLAVALAALWVRLRRRDRTPP